MHDKKKCMTCKYHGYFGSVPQDASEVYRLNRLICDYSGVTKRTCLKRAGKGFIDSRGNDPNNCLLYEKGERELQRN